MYYPFQRIAGHGEPKRMGQYSAIRHLCPSDRGVWFDRVLFEGRSYSGSTPKIGPPFQWPAGVAWTPAQTAHRGSFRVVPPEVSLVPKTLCAGALRYNRAFTSVAQVFEKVG